MIFLDLDLLSENDFRTVDPQSTSLSYETDSFMHLFPVKAGQLFIDPDGCKRKESCN